VAGGFLDTAGPAVHLHHEQETSNQNTGQIAEPASAYPASIPSGKEFQMRPWFPARE